LTSVVLVVVVAVSGLMVLARFVQDLTGLKPLGAYYRWQVRGSLLIVSVVLISEVAPLLGWSNKQLDLLHLIQFPFMLTGLALVIVGMRRARRQRQITK
jgi:hypothetical protein